MKPEPLHQAEVTLEIPFHDLDPAGYVWHGHYAKYLELARCELLKQFDYNYDAMTRSGFLWPVVDLQMRFIKPLDENIKANAGIAVLRGNLAPDGPFIKPSAASPHLLKHKGRAVVFENIEDLHARIDD